MTEQKIKETMSMTIERWMKKVAIWRRVHAAIDWQLKPERTDRERVALGGRIIEPWRSTDD